MSDRCGEELCPRWTGDGCICLVLGYPQTEWCRHEIDKNECYLCEEERGEEGDD